MKLIVGIGNPGEKYKNNRHNVGYLVIEALLTKKLPKGIIVKKTNIFMNSSGEIVKKLVEQYKLEMPNLWVIHDDLDIPLGSYKIQKGIGPKLHYGIASVNEVLGDKSYHRVRIGVDNRFSDSRIPGETYVLQDFSQEERKVLDGVIEKVIRDLLSTINNQQ